jgi:anti-sigma factor RsiW
LFPWWWNTYENEHTPLIVEPVNDLITYQLSQRPLDIASTNPTVITHWFQGKVDFALPPLPPVLAGYQLVGGRLCFFLDRRLSALMYQQGDRLLSLYIMPSDGLTLPMGTLSTTTGSAISDYQVKGYHNLVWQEETLVYSLVSNLPKIEIARFITEWQGKRTG